MSHPWNQCIKQGPTLLIRQVLFIDYTLIHWTCFSHIFHYYYYITNCKVHFDEWTFNMHLIQDFNIHQTNESVVHLNVYSHSKVISFQWIILSFKIQIKLKIYQNTGKKSQNLSTKCHKIFFKYEKIMSIFHDLLLFFKFVQKIGQLCLWIMTNIKSDEKIWNICTADSPEMQMFFLLIFFVFLPLFV